MKRIGLIGFGAIGRSIAATLIARTLPQIGLVCVLTRPGHQMQDASALLPGVRVTDNLKDFLDADPCTVVEAAGHESVHEYGETVLEAGCNLYILSSGALADDERRARLTAAAVRGGTWISIPGGALAGFDGLMSLKASGLESVTYVSTKPPRAWSGTVAAEEHDLENLGARRVLFEGTARQAALNYPRNANLAASVALAGLGLDKTWVRLVADPGVEGNSGVIIAKSRLAELEASLVGAADPINPKTSEITAYSIIAALENSENTIRLF